MFSRLLRPVTICIFWISFSSISSTQWAAVMMVLGPTMEPPQNGWILNPSVIPICQGMEFLSALIPPMTLVSLKMSLLLEFLILDSESKIPQWHSCSSTPMKSEKRSLLMILIINSNARVSEVSKLCYLLPIDFNEFVQVSWNR